MTEKEREQHKHAMRRYRAKYPDKHRAWNRQSIRRRRAIDPEHMRAIRLRSKQKRDALYERLKLKPCTDCNGIFPPCVMEFDHVRGKKLKPVSQLRSDKMSTLMAEISKCDLVCSNCHRMRTHKIDRFSAFIKFGDLLEETKWL